MGLSKFLDPKNNYAFRRIFGTEKNKDILIHFLNDVLNLTGEAKIKNVQFLSPIQNSDITAKKESIVDVLCRDSAGVRFICEMQVARTTGFEKRAQYYGLGKNGLYINKLRKMRMIMYLASTRNLMKEKLKWQKTYLRLEYLLT